MLLRQWREEWMRVGRGLRAIEAESTDGRGGDVARELAVVVVLSGGDERGGCVEVV